MVMVTNPSQRKGLCQRQIVSGISSSVSTILLAALFPSLTCSFFLLSASSRNGTGGGSFKPNLWALGPSEASFAGKLALRQIKNNPEEHPRTQARGPRQPGDRPYAKRWTPRTEGQPGGEQGTNRRTSGARDNEGRERRPRREEGTQARAERTDRRDRNSERSSQREPSAGYSAKNLRIETTDLEGLFGAPSTAASTKVVPRIPTTPTPRSPSRSSKAIAGTLLNSHVQKVLERNAGDYKRYLFGTPQVIRGDSLTTVGPLGYARLTVMRRQDVGLNQRKNGLKIVSALTKDVKVSSQLSAPST